MNEELTGLPDFKSTLGPIIRDFISEKIVLGYKYTEGIRRLRHFDQFVWKRGLHTCALPEQLVKEWTHKETHESSENHRMRFRFIRQFAQFMADRGYEAYVPTVYFEPLAPNQTNFTAYIFTHDEIRRFFSALDSMTPAYNSPLRHIIMPELFRLLYGCGLRVGEALRLTLADCDLQRGILTIRKTKFRKDRLVPVSSGMNSRLVQLHQRLGRPPSKAPLFPTYAGTPYTRQGVYEFFREILNTCGIAHRGKRKGPRIHDFRHTFAVHRLEQWYLEGADLSNRLPALAAYMGHRNFHCTQCYLQLTQEFAAELSKRLEQKYGSIIPRRKDR